MAIDEEEGEASHASSLLRLLCTDCSALVDGAIGDEEWKRRTNLQPAWQVKEEAPMYFLAEVFVNVRERFVRFRRAQTMTEYALVLAAVAIAVYGVYKTLGNSIGSLASSVDSTLTNA
jgi:Flp pilus assembly pilin Flp